MTDSPNLILAKVSCYMVFSHKINIIPTVSIAILELLPICSKVVKHQTGEGLCIQGPPAVWYVHQCALTAVVCVAMFMEPSQDGGLTRVMVGHLLQGASDVMSSSKVPGKCVLT